MAERDPGEPQTIAARCRQWVEDHLPAWEPYRDAIDREEAFAAGDRYENDSGAGNRDRRLTQIHGQEIQDTIRHFAAEATARGRSVEAIPTDEVEDPELAEFAVALVDQELRDPWKGFESRYYEAIYDSREKRLGVVWMDWEPRFGPYGELFTRTIDPRRALWDESYDPHHPMCEVFVEQRRCPVKWIHENFKGSEWVKADSDFRGGAKRNTRIGGPQQIVAGNRLVEPSSMSRDGKAELWFFWWKNDRTYRTRETGSDLLIPPGQRYMACGAGCGYRSPTQAELGMRGKRQMLPGALEGACPTCGGTLERIDSFAEEEKVAAYPQGRRLVVLAPFSAAPEDKAVYDGKWPLPRLRSFPGLFLQAYLAPRKPMGPSDVYYMWDQQAASDTLDTLALQRVYEHRSFWVMPKIGFYDWQGNRFNFREDQFNVIFRDWTKAGMGQDIDVKNASGLDWQGWQVTRQAIQQKLTQYRGVADFGITPDNTKQIAVGTVERLTQQGNIPIEEYNRRKNMELSKFYGVVYDAIRATYTPPRLNQLNIEGTQHALRFWGEDMPGYDFRIEETPEFTGLEKRRSEAFGALVQTIQLFGTLGVPPEVAIDLFASINTTIPRSTVRKFQKALAQAKQQAAALAPVGGAGPPVDESMTGEEPMTNGSTSGGMAPSLAT